MPSDAKAPTPHVVIVGAGLAGITAAINLKTKLQFHNFTIYEQADAVGGTWRDNTYPGCGSDVPAHWYCLSTELNPNWKKYYAEQPELRVYWENLWLKHDLARHTVLSTSVLGAEWSNENQRYTVEVEDVKTGEKSAVEAEAMFYAVGGFQGPLYPKDLPGREKFKGELFHSARWRHDVILKNKRVGVIGNGCSAAQFIPQISEDPSVEVVNFCRTPQWFIPREDFTYSTWVKWIFEHLPFIMRWYRNWIMARSDMSYLIFRKNNKALINITKKILTAYIKSKAPKDQLDKLIPNYAPGCKRIIVDPDYLESLNKPNVILTWDRIESIVENGIKLKTGEVVPLDVIIFGTGYSVEVTQLKVRGSHGGTMQEYFASKGGAMAYVGTCVPGFPNLYILLGPNVASGHASVIFSQEAQINFALQLVQPVLERRAKSFEVTHEATENYNEWLQKRLQTSVWTDCVSYYQAGRNSKTRIIATFPGPASLFWWFCRRPEWNLFHAQSAEAWDRERRLSKFVKWSLLTVVMSLAVGLGLVHMGTQPAILPFVARVRQIAHSFLEHL
ncbi:FAD/NAD(P)-binding domain-containing protein [Pholiota conissans]|uniref:L-ornithine N(5)-monooxygenase [NAD(P)H] n=1 Tax=Pholiota conissans TaxID=109636 RepID=A0A9P5YUI2_9AGAR|nr:FAD/NAD(P)-binding domain-containing protein [Pholiota conissans]